MDCDAVASWIERNGPCPLSAAFKALGINENAPAHRKRFSDWVKTNGRVELEGNQTWRSVKHKPSNQYIPPNIPIKGYNLWAGAMRPGALDYRNIPSRVV